MSSFYLQASISTLGCQFYISSRGLGPLRDHSFATRHDDAGFVHLGVSFARGPHVRGLRAHKARARIKESWNLPYRHTFVCRTVL